MDKLLFCIRWDISGYELFGLVEKHKQCVVLFCYLRDLGDLHLFVPVLTVFTLNGTAKAM